MRREPRPPGLVAHPPPEQWDDWAELDPRAWPRRSERHFVIVPTSCDCEAGCGLLAYVERETWRVGKLEGNPLHPGSKGRTCLKAVATIDQIADPARILHPLKRAGARGEGRWQEVSWQEALTDIAVRVGRVHTQGRQEAILYHADGAADDGFAGRALAALGIDGQTSHAGFSAGGSSAGYRWWMGNEAASPDYAHAAVILLVGSPMDPDRLTPVARRIVAGRERGARLIVLDPVLSSSAGEADHWLAAYPGSEPVVLLAIARHLLDSGRHDREFVRRWWNWQEYLEAADPRAPRSIEVFEERLRRLYERFTFDYAAGESGIPAGRLREVAEVVAGAGTRLATQSWGAASAGSAGGWQVARCLFLLNALLGAVGTAGGVSPDAWHRFLPRAMHDPPEPDRWSRLAWPDAYPLACGEPSLLVPHFLLEGGGVDVLFTRTSNPAWASPGGLAWIEVLRDAARVGLHVALTSTWNATAEHADYVLPIGLGTEAHGLISRATHDGQWLGFRQPVAKVARERHEEEVAETRGANPGGVWDEAEFWIDLCWRIDPDGRLGIRRHLESRRRPGTKLTLDEHYAWMFEETVPGLLDRAAAEGLTPLQFMRRYGVFEVAGRVGPVHEDAVAPELQRFATRDASGRVFAREPEPRPANDVPVPAPGQGAEGPWAVGVEVDGEVLRGFPTPSGRLEFYSSTLAAWGWPELALPGPIESHVHPSRLAWDEVPLVPAGAPPGVFSPSGDGADGALWVHPHDGERWGGIQTGDLVRVETEIGYFVVRVQLTEGIKPGVVACNGAPVISPLSRPSAAGPLMSDVRLERDGTGRKLTMAGEAAGVLQSVAFAPHPDPVSATHCWHQAVRVRRAEPTDRHGDVMADLAKVGGVCARWMALARPAAQHSPDGTRRPYWLLRGRRPSAAAYRLPLPLREY